VDTAPPYYGTLGGFSPASIGTNIWGVRYSHEFDGETILVLALSGALRREKSEAEGSVIFKASSGPTTAYGILLRKWIK